MKTIIFQDGVRGTIEGETALSNSEVTPLRVLLDSGEQVVMPSGLLSRSSDSVYTAKIAASTLTSERVSTTGMGTGAATVIPVIEETIDIDKREVETGTVRISKSIVEHEALVDEPLLRTQVQIERVACDRILESTPQIRYEGDTMIVPVVEEMLVVEKRLMLIEEVRITQNRTEEHNPQRVTLRKEDVVVERSDI